jgi:hypothetical protein
MGGLLAISKASRATTKEDHNKRGQEDDQYVFKVTPSNSTLKPLKNPNLREEWARRGSRTNKRHHHP